MATPQQVVDYAYSVKDRILREWPGYDAPVPFIWDNPPFVGLGYSGQSGLQHCAASVASYYANCGMTPGEDFPWPNVYCPAIAAESDAGGFTVDSPEPGDEILIDWQGDGEQDHAELCVGNGNWPTSCTTLGANTDESGRAIEYERPAGLISRIVRPHWSNVPTASQEGPEAHTPAGECINTFIGLGLSPAGACGMAGNIQQESNFWWDAVEGHGQVGEIPEADALSLLEPGRYEGFGAIQWSFDRRTQLLDYCHEHNLPWYSPEAQMGFMQREIQQGYGDMWEQLKVATDARAAAELIDSVYIRSGTKGARFDYAEQFMDKYNQGAYSRTASPPAKKKRTYIPQVEGDDMLTIMRVQGGQTYALLGGALFAALDSSLGGPGVTEVTMSQGEFLEWYRSYCALHRINALTGKPLEQS